MLSQRRPYAFIVLSFMLVLWPCKSPASEQPRAKLQSLGVNRVAIDPGFGGKDFGASGCREGVYSKNVNLAIARKLAEKIREKLGIEVIMTRDSDEFIPLEERTAIAILKKADLFVSIHCNAYTDQRAYGIETYCLDLAIDRSVSQMSVLEDQSARIRSADLEKILSVVMLDAKLRESRRLAEYVQRSLFVQMSNKYSHVKNRGVKRAPFYVLIGTRMPAILIGTSFISNPRECKRLISEKYQDDLVEAIAEGIGDYIKEAKTRKQ
jgi:N-acetylmuramoyl-L-alanine amidase